MTDKQKESKENKSEEKKENSADEVGGRKEGLEPTRYGDWEKDGRCVDF